MLPVITCFDCVRLCLHSVIRSECMFVVLIIVICEYSSSQLFYVVHGCVFELWLVFGRL